MATTIEDRLARLESRVGIVEDVQRSRRPAFGLTVEEARERVRQPVDWDLETIERFERLVGSFDGPDDLSEHFRDYLYGHRSGEPR